MDFDVDGAVYAQPLYVPDLVVQGSIVNALFIATEHSSVYAFNAGAPPPITHTSVLLQSKCPSFKLTRIEPPGEDACALHGYLTQN
jgi:hypothetical protein